MLGGRTGKVDITENTGELLAMETLDDEPQSSSGTNAVSVAEPVQADISDTLNRTLHQCARDGNGDGLLDLLKNLGDRRKRIINKWDDNKMTALHYAARYNHFDIVRILVEHGANVNHVDGEDKATPLHFAAKYKAKVLKKSATQDTIMKTSSEGEEGQGDTETAQVEPVIHPEDTSEPDVTRPILSISEPDVTSPLLFISEQAVLEEMENGHSKITIGEQPAGNSSGDEPGKNVFGALLKPPSPDALELREHQVRSDSVIAYLVKNGADVNSRDLYGSTPLHFAAMRGNEIALLDLLHQKNISIEAEDKQKMRPLHLAATHDEQVCIRHLISCGAELRCKDDEWSTPMHMAATEGNVEVVRMLFEKAQKLDNWVTVQNMMSDQDVEQNTPLHLAIENGHYEIVKLFLEKKANVNKPRDKHVTPLHLAAIAGNLRIVTLLVEHNARIDAIDADQATPLHKATAHNKYDVVEYLVQRGSNIEKADKDNFTPLLIAASEGHTETIKVLVRLGANIFANDKDDKTAVFWASQENHPDVLKVLLYQKSGKSLLEETDRYGYAPLHIAAQKGYLDVVKALLEAGADIGEKTDEEQTPLHLAALNGMNLIVKELSMTDGTTINDYDENSNTPLHLAALEGHVKVATVLLKYGADIVARNCNLWTPIDCAAATGHTKMVKILLDEDSPIDPTDRGKTTPLHLACARGHAECVSLLISKGANVTIKNADGFNCMDMCIDAGHKDVALIIIQSDKWLEAMTHSHLDLNTGLRVTPMRKLIRKMPDVAEQVFHQCTTSNGLRRESTKFQITFNYELLDDQFSHWDGDENASKSGEGSMYSGSVYGDDHHVKPEIQSYTSRKSDIKRNHPLMIMVDSQREDLLAHPLVTSLLRHKWETVGRYFYYINLLIYTIYLVFLTGFALVMQAPFDVMVKAREGECANASSTASYCNPVNYTIEDASCASQLDVYHFLTPRDDLVVTKVIFTYIGVFIVLVIVAIKVVSEIFQLYNAGLSYFGWENMMEWILYVTSVVFVVPLNACKLGTDSEIFNALREPWQWQVGAIAVFLSWMELVLFIRRLPRFGIYVVMFTHIMSTFIQFFTVFFLFLVAFAISFYMVLSQQAPFASVQASLLKTAVMMIGEFEYDTIFNDSDKPAVYYPEASYIIFVIFAIIMSILIMNLLVGLAVDDIKGVQDQAILTRMAMQVQLALTVESMLPIAITRKNIISCKKVKPNIDGVNWWARCCGGGASLAGMTSSAITQALDPELDEIEKVMLEQEKLHAQVSKLNSRIKEMRTVNQRLEGMLKALIQHGNVSYEEVDEHDEADDVNLAILFN